jgi:hypothetical protein
VPRGDRSKEAVDDGARGAPLVADRAVSVPEGVLLLEEEPRERFEGREAGTCAAGTFREADVCVDDDRGFEMVVESQCVARAHNLKKAQLVV